MTIFDWQNELNRDGHRVVISGQPIAMHCHHYNINLQKTLEDTLGEEGVQLLYRSAEETNYNSLQHLFNQYKKIRTHKSKLEMASLLYQNCGLGIIHFRKVRPNSALLRALPAIMSPGGSQNTGAVKHPAVTLPGAGLPVRWR